MRVGGVARNTGIVALCPIFFTLPRIPRRGACPSIAGNKFTGNGLDLARTQVAILVHELAHIYNAGTLVVEERYGIQETVGLSAEGSFGNAQNFAYYAACEFFFWKWLGGFLKGGLMLMVVDSGGGGVYEFSGSGGWGRWVCFFWGEGM